MRRRVADGRVQAWNYPGVHSLPSSRATKRRREVEAQLAGREGQLERARAREGERTRKARRRFLVGAALLARVEAGAYPETALREFMDAFPARPGDRALFGLPPGPDDAREEHGGPSRRAT